jgi:predicted oxidoreductase (fatty acid repression mutant protein)
MSNSFFKAIKERRSIYTIGKNEVVSEETIENIVKDALKYTPSAFNSQSARAVVLFGDSHEALWELTKDVLRGVVPEGQFGSTEVKLDSFKAGYGTVLFFEDQSVVESLQAQFALYKDNFPVWSLESGGMVQLVVWTALEAEGLGASLQHYNPLIDQKVQEKWGIPASWKLQGQMPFGSVEGPAGEKEFQPLEGRFKVIK